MTTNKLSQVIQFYLSHLEEKQYILLQCTDYEDKSFFLDKEKAFPHVIYMCQEILDVHIPGGKIEKSMRWLGFMQGILSIHGEFTLEELKVHSRPDAK